MSLKTNDLINLLVSSESNKQEQPRFALYATLGIGLALIAITFVLVQITTGMALRSNYLDAIQTIPVIAKQLIPFLCAVFLFPSINRLFYPESDTDRYWRIILPAALLFLGLFTHALINLPPEQIAMEIMGKSRVKCLTAIPLLSLVFTILFIYKLKQGAPSKPIATGFWTGTLAGFIATLFYAFGCTEDSPLFFTIWYSCGILASGFMGAVAGHFFLRW